METNEKKKFLASFVPSQVPFNSWKLKPVKTRDCRLPMCSCRASYGKTYAILL